MWEQLLAALGAGGAGTPAGLLPQAGGILAGPSAGGLFGDYGGTPDAPGSLMVPPAPPQAGINFDRLMSSLGPQAMTSLMGGLGGPPQMPQPPAQMPSWQSRPTAGMPTSPALSSAIAQLTARSMSRPGGY